MPGGYDMTERRLTFMDVDENLLTVLLKEERVQLLVVDSRPELEAGELRRFASVLFATYVGAELAARLEAACRKIDGVRDKLAATAGADELLATLDGSLAAIEDVRHAITAAGVAIAPDPTTPEPPTRSVLTADGQFRTPKRTRRAEEGDGLLGWGWVRRRRSPARQTGRARQPQ
jgi:hypothetical protein